MKKNIILVFLSFVIGVLLARFMFSRYDMAEGLSLTSKDSNKYYFTQLGVYSSYDSMITNTSKLLEFIYTEDEGAYYVFGCITKNKNNLEKIEGYFKENGYITYMKEFNLANDHLSSEVDKIDLLLDSTSDQASIKELCRQTLTIYKEG